MLWQCSVAIKVSKCFFSIFILLLSWTGKIQCMDQTLKRNQEQSICLIHSGSRLSPLQMLMKGNSFQINLMINARKGATQKSCGRKQLFHVQMKILNDLLERYFNWFVCSSFLYLCPYSFEQLHGIKIIQADRLRFERR